ncbi:hypothetical protein PCANC_08150 [Puccinia coronata f. sp. avenae]|uniref:Uncharacterized protein n=1 Tax=Puccinia coronata f. sp. avenae TaxID=200324 RepID=A0A2N5VLY3_9BASI|nr:hypothetical protein PCANC_08150 [Puccinia coronata f. sp. avenae]
MMAQSQDILAVQSTNLYLDARDNNPHLVEIQQSILALQNTFQQGIRAAQQDILVAQQDIIAAQQDIRAAQQDIRAAQQDIRAVQQDI